MGVQVLSERNVRKVARETGLPVVAARSASNYVWLVVTDDHRHYEVNRATWDYKETDVHWTSCRERFTESDRTTSEPKG